MESLPQSAPPDRDIAITLAGGGNRSFYQIGLLSAWWELLADRIGMIACCSAGACTAVLHLTGRHQAAHEYWLARTGHVTRNFDWFKLLRGERPAPHFPIYRDTVLFALADGGWERLRATPFPVTALMARPPHGLPVPLAVPIGLGAYSLQRWRKPGVLHPGIGRLLGFEPVAVDLRSCSSPEAVANVVLASSATPPFTPVGRLDGRPVLDGGLVDNAPAFLADDAGPWRKHLVVLTRPYPPESVGHRRGRWYLCPSEPVPADRWDYTRPKRLAETVALGARDGVARRPELMTWLEGAADG